ncbi:MAG: ABC transporter ATP-binding protein [Betaproteobacteria bacterium]|nr:ABC transporter ATP-binding protein [Betaproteobacteria bacterium]
MTSSSATMSPILELRNLNKRFGALVVTEDVCLSVFPGEIHALIGPNGAGKSCLIGQISGELQPDKGEVYFRGKRIDGLPVHARASLGIARAYQVPRLFGSLSVEGNTTVAEIARTRSAFDMWRPAAADPALAQASIKALERVGLLEQSKRPCATIAHGEKRQLELAMGFASSPSLLLLDEPLAGLGPSDSEAMVALLRRLKSQYAILLVEHDVEAVFSLADRVSVLVSGQIIASGPADQVRHDPNVRSAYLGEEA